MLALSEQRRDTDTKPWRFLRNYGFFISRQLRKAGMGRGRLHTGDRHDGDVRPGAVLRRAETTPELQSRLLVVADCEYFRRQLVE